MAPLLRVALDGFLHSKLQHSVSGLVQPCSNVCFMHIEGPFLDLDHLDHTRKDLVIFGAFLISPLQVAKAAEAPHSSGC